MLAKLPRERLACLFAVLATLRGVGVAEAQQRLADLVEFVDGDVGRLFGVAFRRVAGDGAVEDFAQRVEVGGGRGVDAVQEFGREVSGRSGDGDGLVHGAGETWVGELGHAVDEDDVLWLDVAVEHPRVVDDLQAVEERVDECEGLVGGEALPVAESFRKRVGAVFVGGVGGVVRGLHDIEKASVVESAMENLQQRGLLGGQRHVVAEALEFIFAGLGVDMYLMATGLPSASWARNTVP